MTVFTFNRYRRWCLWSLLVALVFHLAAAIALHAQIDHVQALGDQVANLNTRTTVLESEMGEILWLGRAIVIALIGQVFLLIWPDRRRRAAELGENARTYRGGE